MSSSPGEWDSRVGRLFDRWNGRFPTAGDLALAALAIGAVTGIVLSAGYDVAAAQRSLAMLELTSRFGRAVRAVHAWSGHLLLLLTVAHAFEHLAARSETRMPRARWYRVAATAPLLLGLMLSGFVLRGDTDGRMARDVVAGLLELLPRGDAIATALLGAGPELQLVYVHHVATLTVAVAFIAVEHGRRLWPSAAALAGVLLAALIGGALHAPSLHDGVDPVVKGPWYLVAMQEILHWLSRPGWIWIVAAAPLAALAAVPHLAARPRARSLALRGLAAALLAYALVGAFAQLFRGAGWALEPPWAATAPSRGDRPLLNTAAWGRLEEAKVGTVRGEPEGCLGCHDEVTGIEASHGAEAVGCSGCHLGDPYAPDARRAHAAMVRVPGNLDTAALTCGRSGCHGDVVDRVRGSLMATVRGMIAVDRWAFGEQPTPDGTATVHDLGASPADTHLRQMCAGCHLGRLKAEPGPPTELSRGGGCVACHLRMPERRDYSPSTPRRFSHPQLTVRVTDESCFGCHSRSARISLSYAGWWDSGAHGEEDAAPPDARTLEDGRVLSRATPDVHHEKKMACVDCHLARETMGDGRAHAHQEQATRVRCTTCHRTEPGRSVAPAQLDSAVQATLRARFGETPPPRLLLEDRSGEPLTNAWEMPGGEVEMRGKIGGQRQVATPPARACTAIAGHERLSCQSCHSPWVTICTACHTQWDARAERVDPFTRRKERGAWVEYDAAPRIGPPALGVLSREGSARVEPVVPGMIMTLNGPGAPAPSPLPDDVDPLLGPQTRFLRAYALAVPHTTTRAGRSCASCHADPFALGYGEGALTLVRAGAGWDWRFEPEHEPAQDGLPMDAWIPFLSDAGAAATRVELAPLDRDAQLRTLAVGACLPCHDPATKAGAAVYLDFRESLRRTAAECRVPPYPTER